MQSGGDLRRIGTDELHILYAISQSIGTGVLHSLGDNLRADDAVKDSGQGQSDCSGAAVQVEGEGMRRSRCKVQCFCIELFRLRRVDL